jgi:cobalt-precorrin 5A hydrolase
VERELVIVAGFGFRASAHVHSLRSAYELAAKGQKITALATAENKAQTPILQALAKALALPVLPIPAATIELMQTPTQSPLVLASHATGSLAEAAALAGAGPGARLVSPRHISPDRLATCAIAIGEAT